MTEDADLRLADFCKPAEFGWTPERAEMRRLVQQWSEGVDMPLVEHWRKLLASFNALPANSFSESLRLSHEMDALLDEMTPEERTEAWRIIDEVNAEND